MKLIPLGGKRGQGKFAKVDDEDYERFAGVTWYVNKYGYPYHDVYVCRRNGRDVKERQLMHHLVLDVPVEVDHRNGDTFDCQGSNLRAATHQQNLSNQRKRAGTSSRYKGVHLNKYKSYESYLTYNYRKYSLGSFKDEHIAALMYDFWATKLFGEFARTNFKVVKWG